MTSPNEPGRDDAEQQRDGQDSTASTPAEEQVQPTAETPEQSGEAGAASAEQAGDTEAATEQEPETAQESQADGAETEAAAAEAGTEKTEAGAEGSTESATEKVEVAAAAQSSEESSSAGHEQASGLGEELADDAPKKKKTGLLIGVVAAAVLVLAAAGVGAYMLFTGPSPESVANGYAEVSNRETQDPASVNVDDYKPLICSKAMPQIQQIQQQKEAFLQQAKPQDLEMLKQVKTSVKEVKADGDKGTVTLEQSVPGQQKQELNLNLIKEDGWKLCA